MPKNEKASEALSSILEASLSKSPQLAAKQRRLLQALSDDSKLAQLNDSTPSASSDAHSQSQPSPETSDPEQSFLGSNLRLFSAVPKSSAAK